MSLLACTLQGDLRSGWRQQLEPEGPCYDVNLLDGLSDGDTTELRDLFRCVSYDGQLAPLQPVVDAVDATADDGNPVGVHLARAIGALGDAGVDVWGLAGVAVDALTGPEALVTSVIDLALEAITGAPARRARAGELDLRAPETLRAGLVVTARPAVKRLVATLRGDGDVRLALADALRAPGTATWLHTAAAAARSADPTLRGLAARLPAEVGLALRAARHDDHDTLRDLLATLLVGRDGAPLIDAIASDLQVVGADARVRRRLGPTLVDLHASGDLVAVPERLAWLAAVGRDGRPRRPGEVSALHALLRMLHDANRPFVCETRVLGVGIRADLGNLAVSILGVLAGQDPDDLASASGVLGDLLGAPLSDVVLDALVDSGACPVLTRQLADDLSVLDALARPEARPLLVAFLDVLDLLQRGDVDHLPRLADVATVLVARGGVAPVEAALLDLGPTALLVSLMDAVPALVAPADGALVLPPGLGPAATFDDLLDDLLGLLGPRADGGPGSELGRWHGLLQRHLDHGSTWTSLAAIEALLTDEGTRWSQATPIAVDLLDLDPELVTLQTLGDLLADAAVTWPLLTALDEGSVIDALLADAPGPDDPRTPLAFAAELCVTDTLTRLLRVLDLTLDALDGASQEPS